MKNLVTLIIQNLRNHIKTLKLFSFKPKKIMENLMLLHKNKLDKLELNK